jgi:hypothetical protein
MPSSGMLRRVALVRTDVSEELSSFFIRATRIGEIGITLAVTSNRRTQRRVGSVDRKGAPDAVALQRERERETSRATTVTGREDMFPVR